MFGIGGTEFMVIAIVAVLLFGPDKIPEIARTIGRFTREFKRYQAMMESVVKAEMYGIDADPAKDREKEAREYRKKAGISAPGEETPGGLPVDEDAPAQGPETPGVEDDSSAEGDAVASFAAAEYAEYDPELLAPEFADEEWKPGFLDEPDSEGREEAGEAS
ncbi:MAG: twin-arginine translocase TatA/TatE family subunit [Coriobacteriales bacterium]|nr:twin-arginine translocase TatA/TatE family subunit [Actinomycetes bacterium]